MNLLVAVSFALVGFFVFAAASSGGMDKLAMPVQSELGDKIAAHVQVFDSQGLMLASTTEADVPELERAASFYDSDFVSLTFTKPIHFLLEDLTEAIRLDNTSSITLGNDFLGRGVGFRREVFVDGHREGYTSQLGLSRLRGPFSLTYVVPNDGLDRVVTSSDGSQVVLDDFLPARVIARGENSTTIRLELEDGQRFALRKSSFEAEVHANRATETFTMTLDAQVGSRFSIPSPCILGDFVLPPGSYRVASLGTNEIVLDKSPTQLPQLMELENTRMWITILEIKKAPSLGGDR